MKKAAILLLCGLLMVGCGAVPTENQHTKNENTDIDTDANTDGSKIVELLLNEENNDSSNATNDTNINNNSNKPAEESGFKFSDVTSYEFYFSSGAGGWRTVLYINSDGSFRGNYSDSDMGCTGPGYPNGTLYYCDFTGQFSNPVKIDDYSYEFEIKNISFANQPDEEEIKDEMLYVYSYAYGLDDADKFYMYLPGRSTADFSEDLRMWIYIGDAPKIDKYVLYNKNPQYGFSANEYKSIYSQMLESLDETKMQAKIYEDILENDPLSQVEMNQTANQLFNIWDNELNFIWSYIKSYLPAEEYEKVLAEQREWIKEKDKEAEEDSKEFEGGSMQPMIYSSSLEVLTRDRCYELVNYLKEY